MAKRMSTILNRPGAVAGMTILAAIAAPPATAHDGPARSTHEAESPTVIAHRGAAGTAPENTAAAFRDGRAAGADYFEIDVQLSADGVPFLFHDNTPARTTNVEAVFPDRVQDPITSFTWAELQQLDAGSYFDESFAGERIPHLDHAAEIATAVTGVFIEIKSPANSPGIEQVVADALRTNADWRRLVNAGKVRVIGFDAASNRTFASLAPDIPVQQLAGTVPDAETLTDWADYADSVGTNYRTLTAERAQAVTAAGLDLAVYTVNAPEAVDQALAYGVTAITSDFPVQAHRYLADKPVLPAANGIEIAASVNNPAGDDVEPENGEYVLLRNTASRGIDLSGYLIRDAAANTLTVGSGYILAPGAELRVYTGPGTDAPERFYNGRTSSVLNNGGDSLALWTPEGRLVDLYAN
jgi:glycerophosphoryl diester phosphodiesterase